MSCNCVECSICAGTGNIVLADGRGHYDNETEACDNCHQGVVEECDYCRDQRDVDADALSLSDLRDKVKAMRERAQSRLRADAWRWPNVKPDALESVVGAVGEVTVLEARMVLARLNTKGRSR